MNSHSIFPSEETPRIEPWRVYLERPALCGGRFVIGFGGVEGRAVIRADYRAEFEGLGADQVRTRVSVGMWSEEKSRAAREWLKKDSNQIARSAKNAAWAAAIAAIVSAIAAVVAIWASLSKH